MTATNAARTRDQNSIRLVPWGTNGTKVVCQARADLYPLGATNCTSITIYGPQHRALAGVAELQFSFGETWATVVAMLRACHSHHVAMA